ncbi:zinc finger protein ZAT9-like [Punica granatum]|uniref:C2H2-type domain-containing protein n=2 Tax=Punica granatum TaxID=22663 RepID=A0A218WTK6_PUNGR|nr:zinc finger protein ZAT9-like [Punica granatum]OWM75700.1 hypothetical protein CDL15_Pgr021865 [Punica granatum]PKI54520.1 hypothetical protein CRG98_025034 [Punica granatum]
MEKNRVCKICSRCFSSGKAMGGHMRSHFAKLPLPGPNPNDKLNSFAASSTTQPLKSHHHHHDTTIPLLHSQGNDHARDSSGRSANGSRRPSPSTHRGRRRSLCSTTSAVEPVKLDTPELSAEDVALCLMMLSCDRWKAKNAKAAEEDDGDEQEEEEETYEDCSSEYEHDESFCATEARGTEGEYRCDTCNKCFRSYQALGGHRASHTNNNYAAIGTNRRIFECPYCYRVFDSGQALGGHKKVHNLHTAYAAANSNLVSSVATNKSRINLNLPVQHEKLEDEELLREFEFEFSSALKDDKEEMLRPIKRRTFRLQ